MNLEELIAQLKSEGLDNEKILASLEQMVAEGKITPEDLEKAKSMLIDSSTLTEEEKEKADVENLMGFKFI